MRAVAHRLTGHPICVLCVHLRPKSFDLSITAGMAERRAAADGRRERRSVFDGSAMLSGTMTLPPHLLSVASVKSVVKKGPRSQGSSLTSDNGFPLTLR